MKKNLLISMGLLAASSAALAQSSLTLYGIVDLGLTYGTGSVARKTALTSGNMASSRVAFKGTEDLGGGLNASFLLEGDITPDTGAGSVSGTTGLNASANNITVISTSGGFTFNRMAWVALAGELGQVRLGRDYTPTWFVHSAYDPFGLNGSGSSAIVRSALNYSGMLSVIHMRASNSVSYILPANLKGLRGQVTYAMGENPSGTPTSGDGNYLGARLGYAQGPVTADLSLAKGRQAALGDITTLNAGMGYDFGGLRPVLQYSTDTEGAAGAHLKRRSVLAGVTMPWGTGRLRASYGHVKTTSDTAAAQAFGQLAAGYVYYLSKRTSLYATVSRINNNANSSIVLNSAVNAPGGGSTGVDLGVRHDF